MKTTKWRAVCRLARQVLGTYLDDFLLLAAGACFVAAARQAWGQAEAFAVAGLCLSVYALAVARSRRGGDRP